MKKRKRPQKLTHYAQRRVIGFLGLALPLLVVAISIILPVKERWTILDSVSTYYYTSAISSFVGLLFALAVFLFVYGGYEGDIVDKCLGKISGTAALGVPIYGP